jgi:anthranilate synthase component 1
MVEMKQLLAVTSELLADTETPVSAFVKLCGDNPYSFLLESCEGLENVGRYSIVAWDPLCTLELQDGQVKLDLNGDSSTRPQEEFFEMAREVSARLDCQDLPDLPFVGSLSGYLGYDVIRLIERLPMPSPDYGPVSRLCYPSRFVVFDHLKRTMSMVGIATSLDEAQAKILDIKERLRGSLVNIAFGGRVDVQPPDKERYEESVRKGKEYILDGDIFQVVLSGRFSGQTSVHPLSVYRWLRVKSPSPYMFYLNFGDSQLVGASPETLVKVVNGTVYLRPIAGTRGRSADPVKDKALEVEMLADQKELAEHVMLVDLARNDAGRVCQYGSVKVDPYMIVERYSHVMHIVSQTEGLLHPGSDVYDVFKACFPAGTVSGAPKVRAMQIIDELEDGARGVYAGGVGRFGPGPEMDTCIAIRMMQFTGDQFRQQVGAGIVADSVPEMEYQEVLHKAAQGLAALRTASEA